MLTTKDIIDVQINPSELALIRKMAKAACIGGKSHIRSSDRISFLEEDQLVGQIGTYAGIKYMQGTVHQYMISRWYANQNPTTGDGGSDIPASNIDFKSSLHRNMSKDALTYRLAVRPKEKHKNWVYVLIIVDPIVDEKTVAHIIGWASEDMLPEKTIDNGPLEGAFIIDGNKLNPLPPIRWMWTPDIGD